MEEEFIEPPPFWKRLLRLLGFVLAGLVVLAILFYFVAGTSAFVKGVVLPKVGKALNADVSAASVSFSPFSQITFEKLKVQPPGSQPVFTADRIKVRYRLFSILSGHYVIDEFTVASPVLQIVQETNGTSNVDPITQASDS